MVNDLNIWNGFRYEMGDFFNWHEDALPVEEVKSNAANGGLLEHCPLEHVTRIALVLSAFERRYQQIVRAAFMFRVTESATLNGRSTSSDHTGVSQRCSAVRRCVV